MQFQLPRPVWQIDQGALVQITHPTPPVSQPELSRYSLQNHQRYIVQPSPQIHQGAALIDSSPPIPILSQPIQLRYRLASLPPATIPQTDGAAAATPPQSIPPAAILIQPDLSYYARTIRIPSLYAAVLDQAATSPAQMYTFERPRQLFTISQQQSGVVADGGGTTIQDWFVYPTSQPELRRYNLPDPNRYAGPGPVRQTDGSVLQSVSPIPSVGQPDRAAWYVPIPSRYLDLVSKSFTGAPIQQSYLFPPSQPESLANLSQVRYRQDIRPFIDTIIFGNVPSYIFPVNQPDPARSSAPQEPRYRSDATRYTDGPIRQQTYLFPPAQPDQSRWAVLSAARLSIVGPTIQISTIQQGYLFPVSGFEFSRSIPRSIIDAPRYTDGVPVSQSYIFPVPQPERRYYVTHRMSDSGVNRPVEGTTIQATYLFPTSQSDPYRVAGRLQLGQPQQLTTSIPAVPQSYLFPVGQPDHRPQPQSLRYLVQAPVSTIGSTVASTYLFPVGQPVLDYSFLSRTFLSFRGWQDFASTFVPPPPPYLGRALYFLPMIDTDPLPLTLDPIITAPIELPSISTAALPLSQEPYDMRTVYQDPAESIPYASNLDSAADPITNAVWTVSPSGPVITTPANTPIQSVVKMSGVSDGATYTLRCVITTASGLVFARQILVVGAI